MSFAMQILQTGQQINSQKRQKNHSMSQIFMHKAYHIQNDKKASLIEWKYIAFETLLFLMNLLCFIMAFLHNAVSFSPQELALLNCFSSLFALSSLIFYLFSAFNYSKLANHLSNQKGSNKASFSLQICLMSIFYVTHCNIFCEALIFRINNFSLNLNNLLATITTLRIICIIFYLIKMSKYFGLRTSRVLDIYAAKNKLSIGFAIKCLFKDNGLKSPLLMILICILFTSSFTYGLLLSENQSIDFFSLVYDTVITMTTVGYGQLDHQNFVRRFMSVIVIVLGSFSSSVLTLTFINFFQLTEQEKKAFYIIKKLKILQKIQDQNKKIVFKLLQSSTKRCQENDSSEALKMKMKCESQIQIISEYKKQLKQFSSNETIIEFYEKNCRLMKENLQKIVQKQLLTDNLMKFYLKRGSKYENEVKSYKSVKSKFSEKSNRSRKRTEDNVRLASIRKQIVKDL